VSQPILRASWVTAVRDQSAKEAVDYAKERNAFDRPTAKFEAVCSKLVDSITKIEADRVSNL
jgi:alkylation response protein AidB-like acyl-CoA dehydrogenase